MGTPATSYVYPESFRPWVDIEREAAALRWYELAYLPGLLQTEWYARALLQSGRSDVDGMVAARLERQEILKLAEVLLALGDLTQAREHGETALRIGIRARHCLGQAHAHLVLGRVAQIEGRADIAKTHRRAARACFTEIRMPAPEG